MYKTKRNRAADDFGEYICIPAQVSEMKCGFGSKDLQWSTKSRISSWADRFLVLYCSVHPFPAL